MRSLPVFQRHVEREVDGELQTVHHSAGVGNAPGGLAARGPSPRWRRGGGGDCARGRHTGLGRGTEEG